MMPAALLGVKLLQLSVSQHAPTQALRPSILVAVLQACSEFGHTLTVAQFLAT